MTKRRVSILMLACLSIATAILLAVPFGASAAITTSKWSGAVRDDTGTANQDAFYKAGVVAYQAGTTANLECSVANTTGHDVMITSAKIYFDFGTFDAVAPTGLPVLLQNNASMPVGFEFTVPASATNQVLHPYNVVVAYEDANGPTAVNIVTLEDVAGAGVTYTLAHNATLLSPQPMVPDSEVIYYYDTTAHTMTPVALNSGYSLNDYTGVITFTAAPAGTVNVFASYKYTELVIAGNGVSTVGYLAHSPAVAGSEIVCLVDTAMQTITTQASSAYTINYATGKITMATAPSAWQSVYVYYKYDNAWTQSGTNFAVYSADQAAATSASDNYTKLLANYPTLMLGGYNLSTAGEAAKASAADLKAKADTEYATGDFADAKTDYQAAAATLQSGITADNTLNLGVEQTLNALLTNGSSVVDAYSAKLNAEAKEAKGEACMDKNIGVFYIMLGVAVLLAGLAGVLWAYSRLVAARGVRQV